MMGKVSAWGALGAALLFGGLGLLQIISFGMIGEPLQLFAIALGLGIGSVRTLGKMKGGLRLLAGAWGVVLGMFAGTYLRSALERSVDVNWGQGSYSVDPGFALGAALAALPTVAAAGLALAVLHKE